MPTWTLLWDIINLIKDHYHWYHLSSHQMLTPTSYNAVLAEHQAECGAHAYVSSRKKDPYTSIPLVILILLCERMT